MAFRAPAPVFAQFRLVLVRQQDAFASFRFLSTRSSTAFRFSVFYSWQADAPDSYSRKFIRDAPEAAVGEIVREASVLDSPRVESGLEGVVGTPEVASIMFKKTEACDLFRADVTLVGRIDPRSRRRRPSSSPIRTYRGRWAPRRPGQDIQSPPIRF